MEKEYETKLITCPYCFGKFAHNYVHFKATTMKNEMDVRHFQERSRESDAQLKKQNEEKIKAFLKTTDSVYREFWSKYPGSENQWEYADYPVVTPKNADQMCVGGYITDADGMVERIRDIYGNESNIRICPHCHNPLPRGYGRKPVKFLAVVGITSSGKTVFLAQLLKNIQMYAAKVGIAVHPCSENEARFVNDFTVRRGVPLFMGTPTDSLSMPLFYDFQSYTLVIYDVAGENCVRANQMAKFGPFILNSDGIIFLLDPKQFAMIHDEEEDTASPVAVLDAMFNAFVQDVNQVSIPMAVTFSKSDELKEKAGEYLHSNSRIFQELQTKSHKFDEVTHRNIHGELVQMMHKMPEGEVLEMSLRRHFSNWAYFAVSALGCGVELMKKENPSEKDRFTPVQNPRPWRLEEPLFWILWKWGVIEAETMQERDLNPRGAGFLQNLFNRRN